MSVDEESLLHCREIEKLNQRGGRMLTIVDLIHAGTLDIDMAAFLLTAMSQSSSALVGASPGGAGKTTVMGALLNLIPPNLRITHTDSRAALEEGLSRNVQDRCYVCHEIGRGHFTAYLWGDDVADLLKLAGRGALVAANLHADTLEEARDQICRQCGASVEDFHKISLLIFLRIEPNWRRRIDSLHWSDGTGHRTLWEFRRGSCLQTASSLPLNTGPARLVIEDLLARDLCALQEVRSHLQDRWFKRLHF